MYKSSKCDFKFETPRVERLEFVRIGDTVACRVPGIDRVRTWREAQKSLVAVAVNHMVSSFRVITCRNCTCGDRETRRWSSHPWISIRYHAAIATGGFECCV